MIKIYFDNDLIDDDSYTSLSNEYKLFDSEFFLGSTRTNSFKLSIVKEALLSSPTNILIKEDNTNFAHLHVDNINETKKGYEYELTDALTLLEFNYNASEIFVNGQTTLLAIAQDICSKIGVQLGTLNFRGYNKVITWYDNTKNARDYISYIAELNGGYAQIGTDGKLYFIKNKKQSSQRINIDDCEDFNLGQKHKITKVVFDLGIDIYTFGNDTGDTLYLNPENVFITEESEVEAIYNDIVGLEYYCIDCGKTPIYSNVKAGDIITFYEGNNEYPTIAGYSISYYGGWTGSYKLDVNSSVVQETQKKGLEQQMKAIKIKIDRDLNEISQTIYGTESSDGLVQRTSIAEDKLTATERTLTFIETNTLNEDGSVKNVSYENNGQKDNDTDFAYYKLDKTGFKIGKSSEDYNSLQDNKGLYYYEKDVMTGKYTKDGSVQKNFALFGKHYYGVDEDVDVATFTKDKAMFVSQTYMKNGQKRYGHFYNGGNS